MTNPDANAPSKKYFNAASAPNTLLRLIPANTYTHTDMISSPKNTTIRSDAAAITIMPTVAMSNST